VPSPTRIRPDGEADVSPDATNRAAWSRIEAIRAKYDPDGLFDAAARRP
jgi:hypothetical protein